MMVTLALVLSACGGGSSQSPGAPARSTPSGTSGLPVDTGGPGTETSEPVEGVEPGASSEAVTGEPCGPDAAWVGLFGDGIACIDSTGWKTYNETNSTIKSGQIHDVAFCNGTTWFATSAGLATADKNGWSSPEATGRIYPDAVACDPTGGIWVSGYDLAAHYDGTDLQTYETSNLGSGQFAKTVNDVAVAPDGTAWFATSSGVASYDGKTWRHWEKGHGFKEEMFPERVAVDSKGRPWVSLATWGVITLVGDTWTQYKQDYLFQTKAVTVAPDGKIWAGTYSKGVSSFDGKTWKTYTRGPKSLPSNSVKSLVVDKTGRVWVGTEWGLAVFDGGNWQTYHMSDSPLLDDEIFSLAVEGGGPKLPAKQPKAPGSLTGRIVTNGDPIAGRSVQACVEFVGSIYAGDTPCEDQAFFRTVKTGSDGTFTFTDLPVSKYALTFQNKDGKWMRLTDGYKVGDKESTVTENGTTDLGDLDVAQPSG